MWNILKSLLFQIKVGCLWKKIWALLLLFWGANMAINVFLDEGVGTVTKALTQGDVMLSSLLLLFPVISCAEICGNDFIDRTINQELLGGHSRAQVYFARALFGIMISVLGTLALVALPPALFSAMGYYGDTLELPGLLARLALMILPLFRLGCELIFITCILKNVFLSATLGYLLILAEQMLFALLPEGNPCLMSGTNIDALYHFDGWFTYSLQDLKNYHVYYSMPDAALVSGTVLASVIIGTVFLYLGYVFFRKDDLR